MPVDAHELCEIITAADRNDAQSGRRATSQDSVRDIVNRAVTTDRHDVVRAVLSSACGELDAMTRALGARDIRRPTLSAKGAEDGLLDRTSSAVPRRRIDDDVSVNQNYSILASRGGNDPYRVQLSPPPFQS